MNHLKANYSPHDFHDVSETKRLLSSLTDMSCGGFLPYVKEHTRLLAQLRSANAEPTPRELYDWAKQAILNKEVYDYLLGHLIHPTERQAFVGQDKPFVLVDSLFTFGMDYLKLQASRVYDPYKTVTPSPSGKATVSANTAAIVTPSKTGPPRCTICWRINHTFRDCHAKTCSQCGFTFDDQRFCPNTTDPTKHNDPKCRWVPPKFRNNQSTKRALSVGTDPDPTWT